MKFQNEINGQPHNEPFCNRKNPIQYNITGAISGTSWDKLHQELDLETLKDDCTKNWFSFIDLELEPNLQHVVYQISHNKPLLEGSVRFIKENYQELF